MQKVQRATYCNLIPGASVGGKIPVPFPNKSRLGEFRIKAISPTLPRAFTRSPNPSQRPYPHVAQFTSSRNSSFDTSFESLAVLLQPHSPNLPCLPRKQLRRRRKRRSLPPPVTRHTEVCSLLPHPSQHCRIVSLIGACWSRASADSSCQI